MNFFENVCKNSRRHNNDALARGTEREILRLGSKITETRHCHCFIFIFQYNASLDESSVNALGSMVT